MMWTTSHFPATMKSLTPHVREKAIELANDLMNRTELTKQEAIAISIRNARLWARGKSD